MQTPLGIRRGAGSSNDQNSGTGDCSICNGKDHKNAQCPNHAAKKDQNWTSKSAAARSKPCTKCGGSGHWAHHHRQGNTQRRTQSVPPAAEPSAPKQEAPAVSTQPVTQQAQSQNKKVCENWKKFGVCTAPPGKCTSDHPRDKKGPTEAGKEAMKRFKTLDCNHHLRGSCARGNACLFKHDPAKKGSDPVSYTHLRAHET